MGVKTKGTIRRFGLFVQGRRSLDAAGSQKASSIRLEQMTRVHKVKLIRTVVVKREQLKNDSRYEWLDKHLSEATRDLNKLHQAGGKIDQLVGEKEYGAGAMETLAESLGRSVSQLSGFRKFAQQWPKEEIEQLVAESDSRQTRLSWHHFRALLGVTEKHYKGSESKAASRRRQLIRRCIKEGWNYRQLQAAVQQELGRERTTRPLSKPETAEQGLEEFIQNTQEYLRRFDESWFGPSGAIGRVDCPTRCKRRASRLQNDASRLAAYLSRLADRARSLKDAIADETMNQA